MDFLSLPYDVRYLIYTHLFPSQPQIYLQATHSHLISINPRTSEHYIATNLLRVNKFLHAEASEFLYSSYLFNIIGTKADCLAHYPTFLETTKRNSRQVVRVDAFSNGRHSQTGCLSIQAGTGRLGVMRRRERGEPVEIDQLEGEVKMEAMSSPRRFNRASSIRRHLQAVMAVCVAVLVTAAALFLA